MGSGIRRRVWDGKVLISVSVHEPDSIGRQEYLLIASRVCYLGCYIDQVLEYFDRYIDHSRGGEWWFEYKGKPIPPNRPVGLIKDLELPDLDGDPWNLVLRRGEYPTSILQFGPDNTIKTYWANQLKESCYIRDGNANAVMLLPREDQEALWWSICHSADLDEQNKGSFSVFWKHMSSLMKTTAGQWNVPVRLYYKPRSDATECNTPAVTQKTFSSNTTVNEVIASLERVQCDHLILHGIELNLDVTLGILSRECIYPDGFLHIILAERPADQNL